jgi:hypothetical protein
MTTKQPLSEEPSTTTSLTSLQPLVAPPPPCFPTFSELVEQDSQEQGKPKTRRLADLFDGVLGDQTLLVSDYQRHPEKYGEEVRGLLEQLMQGSKSAEHLTTSERRLLNLATFDYFQAAPLKKEPPVTHGSNKAKPRTQAPRKAAPKREKPRPGIDVPVTELPAYWWLQ